MDEKTVELNVYGAEASRFFCEEKTLFKGTEEECLKFVSEWCALNMDYLAKIDGYLTVDGEMVLNSDGELI